MSVVSIGYFETMLTNGGHQRRKVLADALRFNMAAFPHREVNAVKPARLRRLRQFVAFEEFEVLRKDSDLEFAAHILMITRPDQTARRLRNSSTVTARMITPPMIACCSKCETSEQVAAVRKQPHDERADQRADHAAFAAVEDCRRR